MAHDVIILGGGVAGLSAAVDLSSKGRRVLLLEQKPHLGGRTYSFVDRKTGDVVDNGQHLMMGCYRETRRYLETIGSAHLASLQPNLRIDFLHPKKGFAALQCLPLPAPLHVLAGLMRLSTIPFTHRLKLLKIGKELLSASRQKEEELKELTVDEWLSRSGQTPENRKYLWDIIAIGTLNDDPKNVSALLFYRVLKAAFLGSRMNSSILVPRVGLSELLVDPAIRFIQERGGEVRRNARVDSVELKGNRIQSIRSAGKKDRAAAYISALPYFALEPLLSRASSKIPVVQNLNRFTSSSIITLHLWIDRPIIMHELVALLDSNIQWVFNKTRMYGGVTREDRQFLSIVISGAANYVDWPKEKLIAMARKDLIAALPRASKAKVLQALVIKEKRATFSPKPHIEGLRPSVTTSVSNFFLAGDWTNTGYPATIEGAVKSGFVASEAAAASLGEER